MKLSPDVLLEIMAIIQNGLLNGEDVSQNLRDLDLKVNSSNQTITLSDSYKSKKQD